MLFASVYTLICLLLCTGGELNKGLPTLASLSTDTRQAVRIKAEPSDHVGLVNSDGTVELVFVDDAVSYEPLSPFQLV